MLTLPFQKQITFWVTPDTNDTAYAFEFVS